jgi:hypothetical protein
MRWNQGRTEVDKLIADGELQRVPPNCEHADQLLVQSRKDLASAELLLDSNPKACLREPVRRCPHGIDCGPGERRLASY